METLQPNHSLKAYLTAMPAVPVVWRSSWINHSDEDAMEPDDTFGELHSTIPVDIVSVPEGTSPRRLVKSITFLNPNSTAVALVIRIAITGGSYADFLRFVLEAGEMKVYIDNLGWDTLDSSGKRISATGSNNSGLSYFP